MGLLTGDTHHKQIQLNNGRLLRHQVRLQDQTAKAMPQQHITSVADKYDDIQQIKINYLQYYYKACNKITIKIT